MLTPLDHFICQPAPAENFSSAGIATVSTVHSIPLAHNTLNSLNEHGALPTLSLQPSPGEQSSPRHRVRFIYCKVSQKCPSLYRMVAPSTFHLSPPLALPFYIV